MKLKLLVAATIILLVLPVIGAFADDSLGTLPGDANYPMYTTLAWSDSLGWDQAEYYSTINACDLDGDGDQDLVARQSDGLVCFEFNAETGMWEDMTAGKANPYYSDEWDGDQSYLYETLLCADLDGNGADEVIGRIANGDILVSSLDAETGTWQDDIYVGYWSDIELWKRPQYYQTIQAGDLDGDGSQEIIYRSPWGLRALFFEQGEDGATVVRSTVLGALSDANHTDVFPLYENIHIDDIDGDGTVEVWALSANSVDIWKYKTDDSSGRGGWESIAHLKTKSSDWTLPSAAYYSTWQAADFDGDGIKEIFGRSMNGIRFITYDPSGQLHYTESSGYLGDFSDFTEYRASSYYNSIRAADTDGDGKAELWVLEPDGLTGYDLIPHLGGFKLGDAQYGPRLAANRNWARQSKHYMETLRFADIDGDSNLELMIRGGSGVRTYQYDSKSKNWQTTETAFADYSSGEEAVAYHAILDTLRAGGLLDGDTDLRTSYKDLAKGNWANMALAISTMEKPEVSQEVWDAVTKQLNLELNAVPHIAAIYNKNREHYNQLLSLFSNQLDQCITRIDLTGSSWLNENVPVLVGKLAKACGDAAVAGVGAAFVGESEMLWPFIKPVLSLAVSAMWSGVFDNKPVSSDTSVKVAYGDLKTELNQWFTDNLNRNTLQYEDVVSNWSKMNQVNTAYNKAGEKYLKAMDDTLEPLTEQYKIFAYQALMPLKYQILYKVSWTPSFFKGDHWYDTFSYSVPPSWAWEGEIVEHETGADTFDYYMIVEKGTGRFPHMAVWPKEPLMQEIWGKDPLDYVKLENFFQDTENWRLDRINRSGDIVIR